MKELLTASPTQARDYSPIVETEMEAMVDDFDIQPTASSSKENEAHDVGIQASVDRKNAQVQVKPKANSIGKLMCIYMHVIFNSFKLNYIVWCMNQIKLPLLQLCNRNSRYRFTS